MEDKDKKSIQERKIEADADRYRRMYPEAMESVAEEMESRYKYNGRSKLGFTDFDAVALGKYMQTFEEYLPAFEADSTSRNELGEILKVGLDLVAMQYATLPIQFLASVQPLAEEAGVVYFRRALATTSRAGVTAGDTLIGITGAANSALQDYVSEEIINESTAIGAGPSTGPYNYSLNSPIRKRTITVNVGNGKIKGIDDGEGNILGSGINPDTSVVDYDTGSLTLNFQELTAHGVVQGDTISIIYSQNLPQATSIPGFKYDLVSRTINVRYYLLQASYTSLANFVVKKRFGKALSDDIAKDTVAQINGAVLLEAIKKLRIAAIKNESIFSYTAPSWSATPSAGVSDIDHRRTFPDLIESVANQLEVMSGRSVVTAMIIGQTGRKVLSSLGLTGDRKNVPGPYLYGYFEGIPVFYAPATILPAGEVIFIYRGMMWYESPMVYSPFLPTTIVKAVGNPNVFTETHGVAHGAGLESVVNEFVCRGRIT